MRHAHDQRFQRWIDGGTPRSLALRGAVTLLGDKFAVPAKKRVGCDDGGHFLHGWLPQPLTDFGQRLAFASRQPHTARDLVAKHTIFGHEVLVAQEQFLIDGPRDLC